MTEEVWKKAAAHVLRVEGGYVDAKHDSGGATNWGISLKFVKSSGLKLDLDGDGDIDADDMKALTKEQALAVYKKSFWSPYRYSQMTHAEVAIKSFDMAVNMGPKQAHKLIQRAACDCGENISDDGVLGPQTLASINYISEGSMLKAIRKRQADFYHYLVKKNPDLKKFLKGWLNRAAM